MSSFDELRSLLSEHVQAQHMDRALRLLDAVRQEERRKGENLSGTGGPFGRPNGESAAHAAFIGDALPGVNGVLGGWPLAASPGGSGAWGKPTLDGMGQGVSGGAWGAPGGFSALQPGGWSFGSGAGLDSDEAQVLAGLALGAPDAATPGLGGAGITWNSNPAASFDMLDPAADTSRFAGAFMIMPKEGEPGGADLPGIEDVYSGELGLGGSSELLMAELLGDPTPLGAVPAPAPLGGASGAGAGGALAGATGHIAGVPTTTPQPATGLAPQAAVKFSSVVGGQAPAPRPAPPPMLGGDAGGPGGVAGGPKPQTPTSQPQGAVKFSSVVGGQAAPPRPVPPPMAPTSGGGDADKRGGDSKRQVRTCSNFWTKFYHQWRDYLGLACPAARGD